MFGSRSGDRRDQHPEVLNGVNAKHDKFKTRLQQIGEKYGLFTQVRGLGLLIGCVLSDAWKGKAKDIFNAAEKEGLMILQAGPDVIRFARAWWWKTPISTPASTASNAPPPH